VRNYARDTGTGAEYSANVPAQNQQRDYAEGIGKKIKEVTEGLSRAKLDISKPTRLLRGGTQAWGKESGHRNRSQAASQHMEKE